MEPQTRAMWVPPRGVAIGSSVSVCECVFFIVSVEFSALNDVGACVLVGSLPRTTTNTMAAMCI